MLTRLCVQRGSELAVNARGVQAPAWRRSRSSRRALAGGALKHGAGKKLRRSLSIKDGQRGGTYVVQKEKASTPAAKKAYSTYAQRRFLMRRKDIRGTPGVINIMVRRTLLNGRLILTGNTEPRL